MPLRYFDEAVHITDEMWAALDRIAQGRQAMKPRDRTLLEGRFAPEPVRLAPAGRGSLGHPAGEEKVEIDGKELGRIFFDAYQRVGGVPEKDWTTLSPYFRRVMTEAGEETIRVLHQRLGGIIKADV